MANNTDFTLNKDAYATFDALTLKKLIKQRLNDGGVFTDQIFEGSNISAIIDIISYSYHTLLFYLNQTSSESLFSEATLYENMNRIVKLIDYKPVGFLTSILSFEATANSNVLPNLYTLKRYSYIIANGTYYSFNRDVTFNKTLEGSQKLEELSDNNVLFQGQYFEYPPQIGIGEDFETVTMVVKDNVSNEPVYIDSNSIDVYIKDGETEKYLELTETNNIFLNGPSDNVYEKRLNENGFYEFKFGNGVFGRKIKLNDNILIYYLQSDGQEGKISAGQLDGNQINAFTTPQFELIGNDIYGNNINFLPANKFLDINFTNTVASTDSKEKEDVDEIRKNSVKLFQSQERLVTITDYESYINKNFSSILDSLKVVNNVTYINEYIKYFYDLGLDRPNDDPRFLFNQVKFSTSSQFNNLYFYLVPKINSVDDNNNINFLSTSQKNTIFSSMEDNKMTNIEFVAQDPVYTAFGIGLSFTGEKLNKTIIDETKLVVKRNVSERVSVTTIQEKVNNIFKNYFEELKLGDIVSISNLSNQILSIEGVNSISTLRTSPAGDSIEVPGLSLINFNLIYDEQDISITSSDLALPFFKYPFLYNKNILSNIVVEDV